jgi:charged multivesicular body protein 7
MKAVFLTLALAVASTQALFGSSDKWDGLEVTWGINPFSSINFATLPRTTQDAASSAFTPFPGGSQCMSGSQNQFAGFRYWYNNDPAVILLFDVNGFIAGIQTAIDTTKSNYQPTAQLAGHPFIKDDNYLVLTAYFVDPSKICTTGRTNDDFNNQGTGNALYFQNGTNPITNSIPIPLAVGDMGATQWTEGKCFWSMGLHYWYNVRTDMSCDEFFPFFVLYNSGKVNGFGFAMNTPLDSSRYEHPTPDDASHFIAPYPNCFKTDPTFAKLSTMHVYLSSSPHSDLC